MNNIPLRIWPNIFVIFYLSLSLYLYLSKIMIKNVIFVILELPIIRLKNKIC